MNETYLNNQNQKEQSQKEQSQKEQSQKEQSQKEQSQKNREQSQKEQSQKEQSQKEQSQKEQRQQKLEQLKATGVNVYPYSYKPDYTIQEVLEKADSLIQTEQPESAKKFSLAGRILGIRGQGKTTFIDLWEAHFRLQLYLGEKILGESYEQLKNYDLGDYIGVTGELFKTRMGELTLRVRSIVLLAKSYNLFQSPKKKFKMVKKSFMTNLAIKKPATENDIWI